MQTIPQGSEIRDQLLRNQFTLECMNVVKNFIGESGYRKGNLISELDTLIDHIEESQSLLEKTFPAIHINFLVVNAMKDYLDDEDNAEQAYNWCESNADLIIGSWINLFSSLSETDSRGREYSLCFVRCVMASSPTTTSLLSITTSFFKTSGSTT